MAIRRWTHMATTDFAALDRGRAVALLPIGAVEQHGPHLPLGTDLMIAEAVAEAAAARLDPAIDLLLLPTQAVGLSPEHANFAGTLSLEAETLIAALTEIGRSAAAAGIVKLAILNSHGGQPQIVDLVAQRLRAEADMLVARANTFRFDLPVGLVDDAERRFGWHGGEIETSLMLHIAPDLVRREALADFANAAAPLAVRFPSLAGPGAPVSWMAEDLNPAGATGNAARATAETGRLILDAFADQFAAILADLARWPVAGDRLFPG